MGRSDSARSKMISKSPQAKRNTINRATIIIAFFVIGIFGCLGFLLETFSKIYPTFATSATDGATVVEHLESCGSHTNSSYPSDHGRDKVILKEAHSDAIRGNEGMYKGKDQKAEVGETVEADMGGRHMGVEYEEEEIDGEDTDEEVELEDYKTDGDDAGKLKLESDSVEIGDRRTGQSLIPLVTIYVRPTIDPCAKTHFVNKNLKLAKQLNDLVHVIGPESWLHLNVTLGVQVDTWNSYVPVIMNFRATMGVPKPIHTRWYVLKEFMARHKYSQIFYFEPNAQIHANITEAVDQLLSPDERHIMLMQRYPSLREPLPASQLKRFTTKASGMTSLWSYGGLKDFVSFHQLFFSIDVLNGRAAAKYLVELADYTDDVVLGWYAHQSCWTQKPSNNSLCKAEAPIGFRLPRIKRLHGKFLPLFNVSSGMQPRTCKLSSWSKPGWCVFLQDEAIDCRRLKFKTGMKCPLTESYVFFEDWIGREQEHESVQFLTTRLCKRKPWQ